ncbi:hypothetical protein KC19_VG334800 [Ceratodon purpureus]|uniref:Tektin n=1 Tax=Ceratodon purpureus TaxID=3225 RepID=A0A8T0HXW4_CERPU|nr:hypothetical protein KC19_VG334800 [Ceratodon purpureus]
MRFGSKPCGMQAATESPNKWREFNKTREDIQVLGLALEVQKVEEHLFQIDRKAQQAIHGTDRQSRPVRQTNGRIFDTDQVLLRELMFSFDCSLALLFLGIILQLRDFKRQLRFHLKCSSSFCSNYLKQSSKLLKRLKETSKLLKRQNH